MPTYAYRCTKCEHQFEIFQRITDDPVTDCPKCDGQVSRLLFPVGIVFKGSGFHVNDYPRSGKSTAPKSESTESAKETAASKS